MQPGAFKYFISQTLTFAPLLEDVTGMAEDQGAYGSFGGAGYHAVLTMVVYRHVQ